MCSCATRKIRGGALTIKLPGNTRTRPAEVLKAIRELTV